MNSDGLHRENFAFSENSSRKQEPWWFLFALFDTSGWVFVGKNHADIYWLSWALLTTYLLIHMSSAEFGIEPE